MASNTYDVDSDYPAAIGPDAVLSLMADVIDAALTENIDVVHPTEVVLAASGRRRLAVATDRPARSATSAPELGQGGATEPATLSYSVGAIGAMSALGTLDSPPELPDAHRVWVQALVEQLRQGWTGMRRADQVIDWISRCLAFDPANRPHPRQLMAELAQARDQGDVPLGGQTPETAHDTPRPVARPADALAAAPTVRSRIPRVDGRRAMALLAAAFVVLSAALLTLGAALNEVVSSYTVPAQPDSARTEAPPGEVAPVSSAVLPAPSTGPPGAADSLAEPPMLEADAVPATSVEEPQPQPGPTATSRDRSAQRGRESAGQEPAPRPPDHSTPQELPVRPPPSPQEVERPAAAPGSDLRDPWTR